MEMDTTTAVAQQVLDNNEDDDVHRLKGAITGEIDVNETLNQLATLATNAFVESVLESPGSVITSANDDNCIMTCSHALLAVSALQEATNKTMHTKFASCGNDGLRDAMSRAHKEFVEEQGGIFMENVRGSVRPIVLALGAVGRREMGPSIEFPEFRCKKTSATIRTHWSLLQVLRFTVLFVDPTQVSNDNNNNTQAIVATLLADHLHQRNRVRETFIEKTRKQLQALRDDNRESVRGSNLRHLRNATLVDEDGRTIDLTPTETPPPPAPTAIELSPACANDTTTTSMDVVVNTATISTVVPKTVVPGPTCTTRLYVVLVYVERRGHDDSPELQNVAGLVLPLFVSWSRETSRSAAQQLRMVRCLDAFDIDVVETFAPAVFPSPKGVPHDEKLSSVHAHPRSMENSNSDKRSSMFGK